MIDDLPPKLPASVVGLGTMGMAIANRLAENDLLAAGFDPLSRKASSIPFVNSLQQLARGCDIIVLCLPGPNEVWSVANELCRHLRRGQCILDHSTIDSGMADRVRRLCSSRRVGHIQAPLMGGVRAATKGELFCVAAGSRGARKKTEAIMRCYTRAVITCGSASDAAKLKLIHNIVTLGNATVAMEALALAQDLGFRIEDMLSIINNGTAASYVSKHTLSRTLLQGDFLEGYKLRLAQKDLGLALSLTKECHMNLRTLTAASAYFREPSLAEDDLETDYPVIFKRVANTCHRL